MFGENNLSSSLSRQTPVCAHSAIVPIPSQRKRLSLCFAAIFRWQFLQMTRSKCNTLYSSYRRAPWFPVSRAQTAGMLGGDGWTEWRSHQHRILPLSTGVIATLITRRDELLINCKNTAIDVVVSDGPIVCS